jgi:Protein-L-isoaspartate carboxylmethyltransferase
MPDFVARRVAMVDTQVRPSDVTRLSVISALLAVPREDYVPGALREVAYLGENLDLGEGRCLLAPRTFAKMLEEMAPGPRDLVLDVAAGQGYSSAVLARLAAAVVALEEEPDMAREAEAVLADQGVDTVIVERGALTEGAERHGPYDLIFIQGGVEQVPATLTDQLRPGGRIVALFVEGALGEVRVGTRMEGGAVSWRYAFNAMAPVLPGFARTPEFTF